MLLKQANTSVIQRDKTSLIVKTYALLTVGFIFMAFGVTVGLNFIPQLLSLGKWGFLIASLLATIGTMFLAIVNKNNKLGYIFFLLFTFVIGFFDAPAIAVILSTPALVSIFYQAAILTALITASISIYVLVTKKNFSFLGGFLFTGLVIVFVLILVSLFWHNRMMDFVISGMGAILFSLYILYDTSRLVNENTNPVEIAIALFLDIINLFWMLFELLKIVNGEE